MSLYLNLPFCCGTYLFLSAVLTAFAGYAYLVNLKRPADDPQKKKYYVNGIFVMPLFWPLLLIGWVLFIILKAIYFGLFLILFALAMVFIRKPFWLTWLEKIALKIGGMLMDANSTLIKLTFGDSPSSL